MADLGTVDQKVEEGMGLEPTKSLIDATLLLGVALPDVLVTKESRQLTVIRGHRTGQSQTARRAAQETQHCQTDHPFTQRGHLRR